MKIRCYFESGSNSYFMKFEKTNVKYKDSFQRIFLKCYIQLCCALTLTFRKKIRKIFRKFGIYLDNTDSYKKFSLINKFSLCFTLFPVKYTKCKKIRVQQILLHCSKYPQIYFYIIKVSEIFIKFQKTFLINYMFYTIMK